MKKIKVPSVFKNKYVIALTIFLVWLTFFDQNNFIVQYGYHKDLKSLEGERDYYLSEITKNQKELFELTSDSAHLEKFARENYYMKKDNEDIFVLVPEGKKDAEQYKE
ncbi:MAG: septum formation initiator family protein [Bacteroidia bacterium]